MNRIKIVKAKDFDWEAFKRGEFFILVRSRKSAVKILRFLSDRGYIWGWSETSMLEDIRMKEELLERAEANRVYICAGGAVPTGIGTAICHDDDKFDIFAGARLAIERLEKSEKESEMSDWEKFVKGEVNMKVPKKYIREFLERAAKNDLKFCGKMEDWYLSWLEQDGDSIVFFVDHKIKNRIIVTEILLCDRNKTVDYIPGMK